MPGPYSAGAVFLEVVPVFKDVQNEIGRQAQDIGTALGKNMGENAEKELGKSLPRAVDRALNDPKTTSAAQAAGKKVSDEFGGTFRNSVGTAVKNAVRDMGKDIDVGVKDMTKRLESLQKVTIAPKLDGVAVARDIADLETQLKAAQKNMDLTLEARVNAAQMADDLAKIRGMVEAVTEKPAEIEIQANLGGSFEAELQSRVRALAAAIPKVNIEVDSDLGDVDAELAALRLRAERLGDLRLGIDIPVEEALGEMSALQGALRALSEANDVPIDVHFNAVAALAQATALFEAIEATFEKEIEAKVEPEVKTAAAEREIGAFARNVKAAMTAALADLPDIELDVDSTDVDRKIAAIRQSMKILHERVDIDISAEAAMIEVKRLEHELQSLSGAEDVRLDVNLNSASAAARLAVLTRPRKVEVKADVDTSKLSILERLLGRLGVQTNKTANDTDLAGQSFRGFNGVLLAAVSIGPVLIPILAALSGGILALGASLGVAATGIGPLMLGLAGLGTAVGALGDVERESAQDQATYARTLRSAGNGVRDAQIAVDRARESAAETAEASSRRIRDALRDEQDAQDGIADAQRNAQRAQDDLVRAQEDAVRTQERLTRAREQAQDQLEDMALRLRGGALAERQAVIDLFEAQVAYRNTLADPGATNLEREQATIEYERQTLALEQVRLENGRVAEESARASAAGVEGSEAVVSAQREIEDANLAVIDSQQGVTDANEAIVDAQQRAADAAEAVRDAQVASARDQRDAVRGIEDAQRRLVDAQETYNDALFRTSELGSASMQKLDEAMAKLSPSGQAFALFLFGLRDELQQLRNVAQEGLLPGLQSGLQTLIATYGPGFTAFVGEISGLLGQLADSAATALTSPVWQEFFGMVAQYAPIFISQWGQIAGSLATGFAAIMTAVAPFAETIGAIWVDVFQQFAAWAASPEGAAMITTFLQHVADITPDVLEFIGALAGAFLTLVEALAPYADALLMVFTGFLEFIAGMDPKILGIIIASIFILITAFQLALSIFAGATLVGSVLAGLVSGAVGAVTAIVLAGIALLIGGFALLYANSETFRDGVSKVWDGVKVAWNALVDGIAWAWENVLKPTWDAIVIVATWLWEHILMPIFAAIGLYFRIMAAELSWVWENILSPIFSLFAAIAGWLWENILGPLFKRIGESFQLMAAVISWIWNSVLGPVFELFGAIVQKLYELFIEPYLGLISEAWSNVAAAFSWVWENILKPVFSAFGSFIAEYVAPVFQAGLDIIANLWQGLIDMAKAPIRFIVETVINQGLIPAFNTLARLFGTTEIEPLKLPAAFEAAPSDPAGSSRRGAPGGANIPGFATGGYVGGYSPSPTADNIPAWLTAGEHVQPVQSVQRYGADLFEAFRLGLIDPRMARSLLGGYASGGLVDFGRLLQSLGFKVTENSAFGGVTPGAHMKGSLHYSDNAIDVNWAPGTSIAEQRELDKIVPLAKDYGLSAIWRAPNHFNHAHFDTGGHSILGAGLLGAVGQALAGKSVTAAIGSTVFNLLSDPAGFLRAGINQAADLAHASPITSMLMGMPLKLIDAAIAKLGNDGQAGETIIPGGKVGLYDNGGVVPKGLSGVLNATGGTEHMGILTNEQWDNLQRVADRGDSTHIDLTLAAGTPNEAIEAVQFALRHARRGGVYTRKG